MAINPTRDDRDLISCRRSLVEWPFPRLGLFPWDDDISRWIARSRRGLDDDIALMHRNLFSLEPFAEMQNTLDRAIREISAIEPREFQPAIEFSKPGKLDFMDNAFEVGKDGKLHFKAYFNAKNFDTGDISVKADNNQLIVRAQKTTKSGDSSISESLGRSIPLPPSVDRKHIKATLTKDGDLVVEAPVESPNYKAIRMNPETGLAIQPAPTTESRELAIKHKEGMEVITAEDGSKKVHLELAVGEHFAPDDIKIWSKGNRVYVHGKKEVRKEERTEEGVSSHSESREFYKAFVAPQVVDVSKAHAEIGEGHLVVEAPLFN